MKLLKVKNLAHMLGVVWLLALLYFLVVFFIGFTNGEFTQQQGMILAITFITGVVAFLGAVLLYGIHILFLRKKPIVGHSSGSRMLFFLPLMGLLVAISIFSLFGAYRLGVANNSLEQARNEVIEPTAIPTETVRYVESDPVITCTSSYPNCSGQSIQVRQSACSAITCCQVGDKWIVYPSENECKAAQNALAPTSQPQNNSAAKYPPCTINYSDLGAITYYSIPPEECASKQMEQKTHEVLRDSYNQCVKNYGAENCTNRSNP